MIAAVSLSVSGLAVAVEHKSEPNCEVKGKKVSVKDEAACTKKKGAWMPAAVAPAVEAAPASNAAPAAEAAPVDAAAPAVDHK